jgi:hypothetical protein
MVADLEFCEYDAQLQLFSDGHYILEPNNADRQSTFSCASLNPNVSTLNFAYLLCWTFNEYLAVVRCQSTHSRQMIDAENCIRNSECGQLLFFQSFSQICQLS